MTRQSQIITFNIFNNCSHTLYEKEKKWVPPKEVDQLRGQNAFGF